jgi:PAS domain S-box-containing protein
MELVGRGVPRVCYVGGDPDVGAWVQAAFERVDGEAEVVVETDEIGAIDRIADAQQRLDPRMRSPLVDKEAPFDCVVCTDQVTSIDPIAFVERVREAHDHLPVVLFADDGDEQLAKGALNAGLTEYVKTGGEDPSGRLARRVLDIVDTHRSEMMTRLERERARRMLADNPEIVTVFGPGGAVTYQNPAVKEVLGYSPSEVDDVVPFDSVHPEDWQSIREEFYDAIMDPEYVPRVEYRVEDADGTWRTVESRGRNMLDDPLVNGFVVATRDITERKERERDLEGYRRVVENVGDPMYILDRSGNFTWVNEAFLEHTGYEREFVEGSHVSTFMREKDVEKGATLITELLDKDDQEWGRIEFVAENVEGEIRRYEDNIAILRDDDGNYRGSVGVLRDVTDGDDLMEETAE